MGIRSYIRDRKQVKASRATESGIPNWTEKYMSSESSWDPASSWDAKSVNWESIDEEPKPKREEPKKSEKPEYVATEKLLPHSRHNFPEQYGLSDSESRKPVPRRKLVPPSDRLSSYGDE